MTSMMKMLKNAFRYRCDLLRNAYNFLYFRQHPEQTLWGSVSTEDRKAIIALVDSAMSYPGPIIEIGTLFGFTTQLLAAHAASGRRIVTVDNYSWNPFGLTPTEHKAFTRRVLYHSGKVSDIEIVDGTSREFFEGYTGPSPALIFIDGAYEYDAVQADIRAALALAPAIVSGHDYCEDHPGVVRAVDELVKTPVVLGGTVWTAVLKEN